MPTEADYIFHALYNRQFDELEKLINGLQQNPNTIIPNGKQCSSYRVEGGYPLFTIICMSVRRILEQTPISQQDLVYDQLCRILTTLKNKGANIEMEQLPPSQGDLTRPLAMCIIHSAYVQPNKFIEFLLKLGCNPNNYKSNYLATHVPFALGEFNYDLFIILLRYGLDINKPGSNGKSPKETFYKGYKSEIDTCLKHPEWFDNGRMPDIHKKRRMMKIKKVFDIGGVATIAEIERERLEKERIKQAEIERERLEKERIERERLEQERKAREQAERNRIEAERLAKEREEQARLEQIRLEQIRLEQERLERERLEKERIEKERLEKEHKELQEDNAYLQIAISNSEKCKELINYLPSNYISHNVDFLNELLNMFNHPDSVDKSKVLENIKYLESNKNTDPELGLDERSRDEMGGAYFRLATINSESLIKFKVQFSSQFTDYLTTYNDALFQMADEHMHPVHKKKLLNDF
jgi:hypothetical protein